MKNPNNNIANLFDAAVKFKQAQNISIHDNLDPGYVATEFMKQTSNTSDLPIDIDIFARITDEGLTDDMTGLDTEISPGIFKERVYYMIDASKVKSLQSINTFISQIQSSDPSLQKNPVILGLIMEKKEDVIEDFQIQMCDTLSQYVESYGT